MQKGPLLNCTKISLIDLGSKLLMDSDSSTPLINSIIKDGLLKSSFSGDFKYC